MNFYSKEKNTYKKKIKQVNKTLLSGAGKLPGKVIPAPGKLPNSITNVKKGKTKVFP